MKALIVSRHPAAIEFIRREAPEFAEAPVLAQATAADVAGKVVAGNLPLHLAALAVEVIAVEFRHDPPRGAEYGLADMHAAGARLARYRVTALPPREPRREITWSDEPGSRMRAAWLLLVDERGPEPHIIAFASASIPGVVAVVGTRYVKHGKWSHTAYRLAIAAGVRSIPGRDGWETGSFAEAIGADSWDEASAKLGVPRSEIERFLREWRPRAATRYDQREEALATLAP